MSGDDETTTAAASDNCCASCGKAEVDDVELKICDGCDLVSNYSDECKDDHRPGHEAKCKERAAELRDEILFRQPESTHLGDCPICFLPLPIDPQKSKLQYCCSKLICAGCSHANNLRHLQENMPRTCPFCRHPMPKSEKEFNKNLMKRVKANDPVAMMQFGKELFLKGDHDGAFKYYTKAAELGDTMAHYNLSILYGKGEGVEKDETKEIYHLEEASIRGHPLARYNLGVYEESNGEIGRAVRHWIISASLGLDESIYLLKMCYKEGLVRKDDFAAALRAHHAAINETKSPHREAAAKYYSVHD